MPMATKHSRMVTYDEGPWPQNHVTLWARGFAGSHDKLNISPLKQYL